eukprot:m.23219 g.23219  ORF g.23219 m.23219 type:complete len:79 (+) comp8465_c0_seq1:457-693(+)
MHQRRIKTLKDKESSLTTRYILPKNNFSWLEMIQLGHNNKAKLVLCMLIDIYIPFSGGGGCGWKGQNTMILVEVLNNT